MRTSHRVSWAFIAGMTVACSDGGRPEGTQVFKEQIQAIDKAKGVEATVLDGAETQQRQIEADTR